MRLALCQALHFSDRSCSLWQPCCMLSTCRGVQLLQFIDLGGHGKYLKTALFGMTCLMPDYIILTVAAPRGLDKGTLEHLAAALTLQLPTVIILTKVGLLTGLAGCSVVRSCMLLC